MSNVTYEKTNFGSLKSGDIFTLSLNSVDWYPKYHNIKLNTKAIACNDDGSFDKQNQEYPFNVVALDNGRPRSFSDSETVFVRRIKDTL